MSDPAAVPAHQALLRLLSGTWVAQAIFVAAKLGIADLLRDGPRSANDLAKECGAHAPSLYRVLRALASVGIFEETGTRVFRLTSVADALRSDVPGSMRSFAIMMGSEWVWRSWENILFSVETGNPAFERVYGMPVFDYYSQHPDAARIGAEGLTSRSRAENAAIVAAYDFSRLRRIVDIGGGQGTLLAAVLAANASVAGVLFDLPHVTAMARHTFVEAGVEDRCELVGGDFFGAVPRGADAYLIKKVIHDWRDEQALAILRSCRAAAGQNSRLLLIELVVPLGNEASPAKLLDLLMMVYPGGLERTEAEHRDLLARAGFRLERSVPTGSPVSILEAVPV